MVSFQPRDKRDPPSRGGGHFLPGGTPAIRKLTRLVRASSEAGLGVLLFLVDCFLPKAPLFHGARSADMSVGDNGLFLQTMVSRRNVTGGRAACGTIQLSEPETEWVLQGGSPQSLGQPLQRSHLWDCNSRGEKNGFLRPQLLRLLACRFTYPPACQRGIVVPALPGSRITCDHKPCHADFV